MFIRHMFINRLPLAPTLACSTTFQAGLGFGPTSSSGSPGSTLRIALQDLTTTPFSRKTSARMSHHGECNVLIYPTLRWVQMLNSRPVQSSIGRCCEPQACKPEGALAGLHTFVMFLHLSDTVNQ